VSRFWNLAGWTLLQLLCLSLLLLVDKTFLGFLFFLFFLFFWDLLLGVVVVVVIVLLILLLNFVLHESLGGSDQDPGFLLLEGLRGQLNSRLLGCFDGSGFNLALCDRELGGRLDDIFFPFFFSSYF